MNVGKGQSFEVSLQPECNWSDPISCLCSRMLKAIPVQAWTGREGSRRFRLPDFMTFGTCRW